MKKTLAGKIVLFGFIFMLFFLNAVVREVGLHEPIEPWKLTTRREILISHAIVNNSLANKKNKKMGGVYARTKKQKVDAKITKGGDVKCLHLFNFLCCSE